MKQRPIRITFASILCCLLLLTACSEPTANSAPEPQTVPEGSAACFFEHINYDGASFCVEEGSAELAADWDNRISSVQLAEGYSVTLFDEAPDSGELVLAADAADLRQESFNDLASAYSVSDTDDDPPVADCSRADIVVEMDYKAWGSPLEGDLLNIYAKARVAINMRRLCSDFQEQGRGIESVLPIEIVPSDTLETKYEVEVDAGKIIITLNRPYLLNLLNVDGDVVFGEAFEDLTTRALIEAYSEDDTDDDSPVVDCLGVNVEMDYKAWGPKLEIFLINIYAEAAVSINMYNVCQDLQTQGVDLGPVLPIEVVPSDELDTEFEVEIENDKVIITLNRLDLLVFESYIPFGEAFDDLTTQALTEVYQERDGAG